jgi:hypothetical protein
MSEVSAPRFWAGSQAALRGFSTAVSPVRGGAACFAVRGIRTEGDVVSSMNEPETALLPRSAVGEGTNGSGDRQERPSHIRRRL